MALTTKAKPKAHHRKRQAQHHKQTKHYSKAYWPYLPMLLVVAVGIAINSFFSTSSLLETQSDVAATTFVGEGVNARPVSRIELLAGDQATNALLIVIFITAAAFMYLLFRHGRRLTKTMKKGERFISHHPLLDIAVVMIVVIGVILTRSGTS